MRKGPEQEADGGKDMAFGTYFQAATHAPGPLHKLPLIHGRCGTSAIRNPRADLVLQCKQGKCQRWEKGVKGMVRVCKARSLFIGGNLKGCADNKLNKLTSDSFL